MASEKRNFKQFDKFPGKLNKGTGIYEFPLLQHIDALDRKRTWQIFIRLIKSTKVTKSELSIDWELLNERQQNIEKNYLTVGSELPTGTIAQMWVETGIANGKITRHVPTYFKTISLEGRVDQRNQFQQALIKARNQHLTRKNKGGSETETKQVNGINVMYFPMLAKTYIDGKKHLRFPLYIQPKLNGNRCLVFLKKKDGGVDNVVVYSRTLKLFPGKDYLKIALYPHLNDLFDVERGQSIYFDGEMYRHGKRLQDITGDSRNERETKEMVRNEYHIYDCFYPLEKNIIYESRKDQLENLFIALSDEEAKIIKPVTTILITDEKGLDEQFYTFIAAGYEGLILRNVDGPYLTEASLRSKNLVKLKQLFTDEYKIVGFTEGTNGKDKGALLWVCTTESGEKFNVTPKDTTLKERYALYKKCKKDFSDYDGRMLTIEYAELSKDKVPQHAKGLVFRDYE